MFFGVGAQFFANPGDGLRTFGVAGLRHGFRRHSFLFERGGNFFPLLEAFAK